ncbi:MAG: hypothetical protein JO112_23280 [Planctomycetes bacterium]|nr:hypothetical protein [Planctomycetota bacterium]
MASTSGPSRLTVEEILEAIGQLSLVEQREFQRRLAIRQAANGNAESEEAALVRTARAHLPATAERRLRRLIARSERGQLTPKEVNDYRSLAQEAQRLDAARALALAELARRWGRPVQAIQAEINAEGPTDDA